MLTLRTSITQFSIPPGVFLAGGLLIRSGLMVHVPQPVLIPLCGTQSATTD